MPALRLLLHVLSIAVFAAACASNAPSGAVAPAAGATPRPPLHVRALDPSGAPLAAAHVHVLTDGNLRSTDALLASRSTGDVVGTLEALAIAHGTTDAQGRATLDLPGAANLMVAVESGAFFGQRELASADVDGTLEITATPRLEQRVLVRDASGAPQEGVAVSAGLIDERGRLDFLPATATTDAQGVAVLHVPDGAFASGTPVVAARVAADGRIVGEWLGAGTVELRLPPAHVVSVTFEDPSLEGLVQVFPARDGSRSRTTLARLLRAPGVSLGPVETGLDLSAIAALRERGAPVLLGRLEWSVPAERAQDPTALRVPLESGVLLSGRLADAAGRPLAEADVELRLLGAPRWNWSSRTDAAGRFRWLVPRAVAAGDRLRVVVRGGGESEVSVLPETLAVELDLGELRLL